MKKIILIAVLLLSSNVLLSQNILPNVAIKTLDGKTIQTSELSKDRPIIISLWATWCVPCKNELDAINDVYIDWQDETGVTLYAISVDDSRTIKRVKPLVNGKDWDFEVLLDTNQDLKRALGVSTIPVTLIVKDNKIVYRHSGYTAGAEDELYAVYKKHLN